MNKLVYGVGTDDLPYSKKKRDTVGKILWRCPYYSRWRDMIRRCYSSAELIRNPSYIDVHVCKEWLTFSCFKSWMEKESWGGLCLDKDIIGDSTLYSPQTCAWVPSNVNTFLCGEKRPDNATGYIGVCFQKDCGKYRAQCKNPFGKTSYEKRGYIGLYDLPEDAHEAWRYHKEKYAKLLIQYSEITDARIISVLINKYKKEFWYS